MHYVIQNNLWNEKGFDDLLNALKSLHLTYSVVQVVPFSHALYPDVDITPRSQVIVFGATTLCEIAQNKGWNPGAFMDLLTFDFRVQCANWGRNMLNYDARVVTIGSLSTFGGSHAFIRPVGDGKAFAGEVMSAEGYSKWREEVMTCHSPYIGPRTPILVASPKVTIQEYRMWVVNKEIVTYSQYKERHRVSTHAYVPQEVLDFTQSVIDMWTPSVPAFVIDVAVTEDRELKIVEVNCLNSSGFYACDVKKLIESLEKIK